MTTAFYAHTDTPDGPFTVIVSDGAVLGSGWTSDPKDLLPRIHQSLLPSALEQSDTEAEFALDAVRKYYDGDFAAVLRTPVRQVSGEFRSHAWDVLRGIGPGQCGVGGTPPGRAGGGECVFAERRSVVCALPPGLEQGRQFGRFSLRH